MVEALQSVAVILLVLEAMVLLLIPGVVVFGLWYGVRWLRRKLLPLFAQARKYLSLAKLYVERASAALVAPLFAAHAAAAQLRAWWNYLAGFIQEEN